MTVPSEYNVDDGFLGLGEFILLEVLNEIIEINDMKQYLVANKKIYKLKDHSRFQSLIKNKIDSIIYNPLIPSLEDIELNDNTFKNISGKASTILFDPIIRSGIVKFEVLNIMGILGIGIADDSVSYQRDQWPAQVIGWDKIVYYSSWKKGTPFQ
ncbi:MAG: hypothetical protein EZS28_001987 [Streblomastix strix]|uniref:Uncharacterized protein n=1 Tax=Streblomastix strix TaxID=222440 RepID=A0A5J4X5J3_9EUKA|nr:MAG: hypothetical protein EZS28_001987 [Streblomastix strix]